MKRNIIIPLIAAAAFLLVCACGVTALGAGSLLTSGTNEPAPAPTILSSVAGQEAPYPQTVEPSPAPVDREPVAITRDVTQIRQGPGPDYPVSHVLSANTTIPILGRHHSGDWWAVPGPGDGPGPVAWVSAAVVDVQGNVEDVPVVAAPPQEPELPVVGSTGQPDSENCTISHPGPGDLGPVYVYRTPELNEDEVVAILGLNRWITVVGRDNAWYHVQDSSGISGWVVDFMVAHSGSCQADDGPGSLPLIENPGAPPADVCLASRPGQFPPPDIRQEPGDQFPLVARLGNWAKVIGTEDGWYQIDLGQGEAGWVSAEDVDLSGPCSSSASSDETIHFSLGAASVEIAGILQPLHLRTYRFHAYAGQLVSIEITSDNNRLSFGILDPAGGHPYKLVEDGKTSWQGILPVTQEYILRVASPAVSSPSGYQIEMTIDTISLGIP